MNLGVLAAVFILLILVMSFTSYTYHSDKPLEHMLGFAPVPSSSCPPEEASFDQKKFIDDTKCFAHETVDCKDVLKHLKIPATINGMSDKDASAALDVLANNTYMNISDSDNTLYSTNQCVIPKADVAKLNIDACRIGDVQMRPSNPQDEQVVWTYDNGCVISESQLKNNLGEILKHIDKQFKQNKETIQSNLGQSIQDNKDNTASSWSQHGSNTSETDAQRRSSATARSETQSSRSRTTSLAASENSLSGQANTSNSSAGTQEGRNSQMRKDCVMEWQHTACNRSCGGGTEYWKYKVQQAAQNGGSCQSEQTYAYSCNTHACPAPPAPSGSSRIGISCPTGATRFYFNGNINGWSSDQARAACETCYGSGQCQYQTGDCAGHGWQAQNREYSSPVFGFQSGCSGNQGRIWPYGWSYTTHGRWDQG